MFCPKCGNANQTENTYCRQCGTFLLDLDQPGKKKATPEEHLKANTVLNFLTAGTSLTLAILLYYFFLGKENTHPIIYVTAGFLLAIFGWQVQIIIRTFQLKKHFKKRQNQVQSETSEFESIKTKELLNEADFSSAVPPSVTERTTRHLDKVHQK